MSYGPDNLRFSADFLLSRDSSQLIPIMLDEQFLQLSISRRSSMLTLTTQDQTDTIVGELTAADNTVCNGANYQIRSISCPAEQPGIGFLLLLSLHEVAAAKDGAVFYETVDDSSRQWLIANQLSKLLPTPPTPNT